MRPAQCSSLLVLALAACQAPPPAAAPAPPLVVVQQVALETYSPTLTLTGAVRAQRETPLAFQISGQITELAVDVGDRVTSGQLLARLAPEEQQADVAAGEATLEAARAQVQQAQMTFERQKSLLDQGLTTRASFEQAQTALQTAQSSQATAQAQLDTAKQALSYTELHAASDGVITQRSAQQGEVAQAGAQIFKLAEDGLRDAVFNVAESALAGRSMETPVALSLVSDPNVKADGRVREVSPTIDTQTGTVEVKVEIGDTSSQLPLGAPISGSVPGAQTQRVVLPASALWLSDGRPTVWTVGSDRTVAITPITIVAYETGRIIVSDGLVDGQLVVTDGNKLLIPGETVTVEKAGT